VFSYIASVGAMSSSSSRSTAADGRRQPVRDARAAVVRQHLEALMPERAHHVQRVGAISRLL
jgi:hypothetical protein